MLRFGRMHVAAARSTKNESTTAALVTSFRKCSSNASGGSSLGVRAAVVFAVVGVYALLFETENIVWMLTKQEKVAVK